MPKKNILYVEDDENDVFLVERAFRQAGIDTPLQVVRDGQVALDYLAGAGDFADRQAHPLPFLILLDLKLPKINGFQVLEWLSRQPHLKKLVVVVFSASAAEADVARAYELGANSYVKKPARMEETVEMANLLKGWWLRYNQFAPVDVAGTTQAAVTGS